MNARSTLRRAILFSGALTLSMGAVAAPNVEQVPVSSTRTVKYNPMDAATTAGAARLYGTLRHAAGQACRESVAWNWSLDPSFSSCRQAAVGRAVDEIAIPSVSALHAPSSRKQTP